MAEVRTGDAGPRRGGAMRWVAASLVLVLAAVLGVASVLAVWLRGEVLNTDRYVATVAPLASDPVLQDAVAARISSEVITRVDVRGLATSLVDALRERGAPQRLEGLVAPVVSSIESFVEREVQKLVSSEQFAQAWVEVNRIAHDGLDAVLTGRDGRFISTQGTQITIDLGQFVALIKQRLVAAGFSPAELIPQVSIPYTLVDSEALPKLRAATSALNSAAWVLPLIALVLLAIGVAVAPDRRRGLLTAAVLLGTFLLLAIAGLAVARTAYLADLPSQIHSYDAAATVWDTVLRNLRTAMIWLAIAAAVVVIVCWLAGPSRPATAIRRGVRNLTRWATNAVTSP